MATIQPPAPVSVTNTQTSQQPAAVDTASKPTTPAPKIDAVPNLKDIEVTSDGTRAISDEAVQKQLESLNELLKAKQTSVKLEYDKLSSPKVINIVDSESGRILRTMPPQVVVEIAEKAKNYVLGLMIDKVV